MEIREPHKALIKVTNAYTGKKCSHRRMYVACMAICQKYFKSYDIKIV